MKTKITIQMPRNFSSKIKKTIDEAIDLNFKKDIAQEIVEDIQINTRRGYGIKDGKRIPLKPLKNPETVKQREYLERAGNATAKPFNPNLSNLSVSGQLIDSIGYEILPDGTIDIGAKGERTSYKKLNGESIKGDRLSNEELARIHHEGNASGNLPSRPFIGLREEMKNRFLIKLREKIRRSLETIFVVKRGS